jgi:ABC-type uncharacterized transport system substrate-binding protein
VPTADSCTAANSDPVNRGLVASLSRPGGNTTGFTQFEFGISGKWLELLKEIAPGVTRAAVIRDPTQFSGVSSFIDELERSGFIDQLYAADRK